MWTEIPIPDETDLPKALEVAGLKTMEVFEKKVTSEVFWERESGIYHNANAIRTVETQKIKDKKQEDQNHQYSSGPYRFIKGLFAW